MTQTRRYPLVLLSVAALLRPTTAAFAADPVPAPPLHVSGRYLVDDSGRVVQPRGVNRSSSETLCLGAGRTSFFYGPTDAASVAALKSWDANMVRIPVNEDCWLGRNGLPKSLTAADYRAQIEAYVRLLVAGGLNALVDVHFAETTTNGITFPSTGLAPMVDQAHGAEVWQSIATEFRDDPSVLFDLYNEPHDITWRCWRDGCSTYAGMQELVDAVRAVGATNPIVLTGPSWGNELSRWLEFEPVDPGNDLVAGVHVYPESGCATRECMDQRIVPIAAQAPVIVGEFGDTDCSGLFLKTLADWADPNGIGYLAFTWNVPPGTPCGGYHLISSFDGTPTPPGAVYRGHLLTREAAG